MNKIMKNYNDIMNEDNTAKFFYWDFYYWKRLFLLLEIARVIESNIVR